MGFLDKWMGRKSEAEQPVQVVYVQAETLDGSFPSYGGHNRLASIWDCDLAWQALDRIIKEVAKITPVHVVRTSEQLYSIEDDIQRVLRRPNELMTAFDMTCKVLHTLYTRGDAFIYPVYEGTKLYSLNPVIPTGGVDWLESGGEIFVRLKFTGGREYILPYMSIIHIRLNYGEDEYMGSVRETPLLSNMQINNDLLNGVAKGVSASATVNGIVKYGTALSRQKLDADIKAFSNSLKNNESGLLGLDNTTDYTQIKRDVKLVDADTLKYVEGLVLNHFGTPAKIIDGTASRQEEELWYRGHIQPLLECLGQAYGRVLFSGTQTNKGHEISWYSKDRLRFMTGAELNEAIKQLTNVGALMLNQILESYGFPPLGEEGMIRPMSLNYIDSKYATQYQLDSLNKGGKTNEKQTQDG